MAIKRSLDANKDLIIFEAYLKDLREYTGVAMTRMLKDAGLDYTAYAQVRRYLDSEIWDRKYSRPKISLSLLLHLGRCYNYPLDCSKYIHHIKSKEDAKIEHEERERLKNIKLGFS